MSHTLAYAAIVVLLPWAWARLSQLLATRDAADPAAAQSRPRWLVIVRRLEGLVALASLLVTIRFLQRGGRGAPSLPMLLTGITLMHGLPSLPRPPAFDFMEQHLIWRCVADVMLAGRRLWRAGPQALPPPSAMSPEQQQQQAAAEARPTELFVRRLGRRLGLLPQTAEDEQVVGAPTAAAAALACVFCGAEPPHTSQPVSASCSHRACYYCVATARLASTRARAARAAACG